MSLSKEINAKMIKAHNSGMLWKRVKLSTKAVKKLMSEYGSRDRHFIRWLLRGAEWYEDIKYTGNFEVQGK